MLEDADKDPSTQCTEKQHNNAKLDEWVQILTGQPADNTNAALDDAVQRLTELPADITRVAETINRTLDMLPPQLRSHLPMDFPDLCSQGWVCDALGSVLGVNPKADTGASFEFGPISLLMTNDQSVFDLPAELADLFTISDCPDFGSFRKRNWVFGHMDLMTLFERPPGVKSLGVGTAFRMDMSAVLVYMSGDLTNVAAVADSALASVGSGNAGYFSKTFLNGMAAKFRFTAEWCPESDGSQTKQSREVQKLHTTEKRGGCVVERLKPAGTIVTIKHHLDRATSCDVVYTATYLKDDGKRNGDGEIKLAQGSLTAIEKGQQNKCPVLSKGAEAVLKMTQRQIEFDMDDTYTCPTEVTKDNWVLQEVKATHQYAMDFGATGTERFYIQPAENKTNLYTIERTDSAEPWTFDLSFVCSADPFMVQKEDAFRRIDPEFAAVVDELPLGASVDATVYTPDECVKGDLICWLLRNIGDINSVCFERVPLFLQLHSCATIPPRNFVTFRGHFPSGQHQGRADIRAAVSRACRCRPCASWQDGDSAGRWHSCRGRVQGLAGVQARCDTGWLLETRDLPEPRSGRPARVVQV
jgi:hypothetical protein